MAVPIFFGALAIIVLIGGIVLVIQDYKQGKRIR